nr:uncharacterized protein LOC101236375 [Hydra vulgaris]
MTDLFFLPSKAYIQVEERVVKANKTSYANTDAVSLTRNGIVHLFKRMKYDLSEQNIETKDNLGQATTMQAYIIQKPTDKGTFSFIIPLKHVFGFCDDYTKVLYGFKHTLTLQRKHDNDAIFRSARVTAGKVNLTKASLWMPYITPSDTERLNLDNVIREKVKILAAFCSRSYETITLQQTSKVTRKLGVKSDEKPRYAIVRLQTNKDNDQTKNALLFDHCNLTNMQVMINNVRFPEADYELSFPNQQFSRTYKDASAFKGSFYGTKEIISNCNITPSEYKDLYPLMVFDLSKQSESLKPSVSDI